MGISSNFPEYGSYSLNGMITCIMLFRVQHLLRVYRDFSKWTSPEVTALCTTFRTKPGLEFAFQSDLLCRPFKIMGFIFVVSSLILSLMMHIFEDSYEQKETGDVRKRSIDLSWLNNCLWVICATITSVGQGDGYPQSGLGKMTAVLAILIGMQLLATILTSFRGLSTMSPEEEQCASLIEKA